MSRLIAFSGGCFSGKTTTMNKFFNEYKDKLNIVLLTEEIRKFIDIAQTSIDEIRKDNKSYFNLEQSTILTKISTELYASMDKSDTVYFIDRSIIDSNFYFSKYLDPSAFNKELLHRYDSFKTFLAEISKQLIENYHKILLFKPLKNIINTDKCRPANIDEQKYVEYNAIYELTNMMVEDKDKIIEIDLNNDNDYEFEKIKNIL